jgi:hypothetical protein
MCIHCEVFTQLCTHMRIHVRFSLRGRLWHNSCSSNAVIMNRYNPSTNIRFFLIANKHGQTRVAKYYVEFDDPEIKLSQETEIIKKCTSRAPSNCNFFNHEVSSLWFFFRLLIRKTFKVIYRIYRSLYVIVGVAKDGMIISFYELSLITRKWTRNLWSNTNLYGCLPHL